MKHFSVYLILSLSLMLYVSCDNKDNAGQYDPGKQITPILFYPDSGKIADKIVLEGENFGNNPENIKVYFNRKRAAVIGASGSKMLVIVPKMPGDTCTVSVVIGKDSVSYAQKFKYKVSVSVTTITGNGTAALVVGNSLATSTFQTWNICVDDDGNIFALAAYDGRFIKLNERDNSLTVLATEGGTMGWSAAPCVARDGSGIVSFPSDNVHELFWTCDPIDNWVPRTRFMKLQPHPTIPRPTNPWKKSIVFSELDNSLYTLFRNGQLVKINPETYIAEYAYQLQSAESFGLAFHPINKNLLYISYDNSGGPFAHSICVVDITNPDNTINALRKITGPSTGGHRDGELAVSLFKNPRQITFDEDGNLYVADMDNHCIRRITVEGMVETVVGIPGIADHKDGGPKEALFNRPSGISLGPEGAIYISDYGNCRIKKLAVE